LANLAQAIRPTSNLDWCHDRDEKWRQARVCSGAAELALETRNAREMADLLVYFAGLLRGEPADPDMPFVEALPSSGRVARALERMARDGQTSPGEMMEGE
jgi:hypothetical protein